MSQPLAVDEIFNTSFFIFPFIMFKVVFLYKSQYPAIGFVTFSFPYRHDYVLQANNEMALKLAHRMAATRELSLLPKSKQKPQNVNIYMH